MSFADDLADHEAFVSGGMSSAELACWLEAEAENMVNGRGTLYGFLLQSQRDVETAKATARVWGSVYARLFQ